MKQQLLELWKYRELLWSMVQRDLKIRYKNSFLGFLWSFVNPALTVLVFWFVFKHILKIATENYSAYLLAALLPFQFFQQSILDSCQSVVGSLGIIRKVMFPREILPLAMILANFIHFLLAIGVFFAFLLLIFIAHPGDLPFRSTILILPLLLFISLALSIGLGLLVSALNVFYEDVKYLVQVGLFLLFYLCPILYFSEHVKNANLMGDSNWGYWLYHLNPIAMLVVAYRKVLLPPMAVGMGGKHYEPMPLDWRLLLIACFVSLFLLWYGYWKFNKLKYRFVERS